MSKIIKLTPDHLCEIQADFANAVTSVKLADGRFTFTHTFPAVHRKATLYFTELAYLKMLMLVWEFDKEVGWHGIARRGENSEKDEYIISDILVYPQEVTGATVDTDQEQYELWLMGHDDEVFNNIRMQGHSHVNMGTTPSCVDTTLYEEILSRLDDDMFYIFLIWNKRNEKTIKIYDMGKNVLFETGDVTVSVLEDGTGIDRFMKNAKEVVKDKKPAMAAQYGGYVGGAHLYTPSQPAVTAVPKSLLTEGKSTASLNKQSEKPKETKTMSSDRKNKKRKKSFRNVYDDQIPEFPEDMYGGYFDERDPYDK